MISTNIYNNLDSISKCKFIQIHHKKFSIADFKFFLECNRIKLVINLTALFL